MTEFERIHVGGRLTLRAANGCACLEFPESHVAHITYEGVAYESFVEPIVDEIERRGRFPIALAVDAAALSSYETGFRKLWTDWMAANSTNAILILSRSRLVAMGIALANAVLGGTIRGFSSREEFERAVAAARGARGDSIGA